VNGPSVSASAWEWTREWLKTPSFLIVEGVTVALIALALYLITDELGWTAFALLGGAFVVIVAFLFRMIISWRSGDLQKKLTDVQKNMH